VHDNLVSHRAPAPAPQITNEISDHFLDTYIDIGAIKGRDPSVDKRFHIANRFGAVHRPMITRQLPTTSDNTGNHMAGAQRCCCNTHFVFSLCQ
jgi:hypothetical protein